MDFWAVILNGTEIWKGKAKDEEDALEKAGIDILEI